MNISFDQLPADARVWIYTTGRLLTGQECSLISLRLNAFLAEWASHGNPLKAACMIIDHAAVAIAVENGWETASGCSIDKSVRVLKELEQELGITFFDRMKIWCKPSDDAEIRCWSMPELKKALASGEIGTSATILDTQVSTAEEVRSHLWKPVKDSWMARWIPGMTV